MISTLNEIARALGGRVSGNQVLAPGPGHGRADKSLSVMLSPGLPDGILVHSFAGDDWRSCRDYVREKLGIGGNTWKRAKACLTLRLVQAHHRPPDDDDRIDAALALWSASVDPRGTPGENYLNSRELNLGEDLAGDVLRWNGHICALLALFRNIETNRPQAVSRIFVDRDGKKIERRFLGPVGGAAIKLDSDEDTLGGLHIGEGVETCLAGRQMGLRPAWALGSCVAIRAFPVLSGIEELSILREHDEGSRSNADACALRWHRAGRRVFNVWPKIGKDINDAIRGAA